MSTEEERRILEDIKKTGYPLEVDVARWLMEKGWGVFPQWAYVDEITKKVRTIDLLAMPFVAEPVILFKPDIFKPRPILLVECKKSKKPWVFLTTGELLKDSIQDSKIGLNTHLMTSMLLTWLSLLMPYLEVRESQIDTDIINSLQIHRIHLFNANLPRAHFCHVAFRGNGKEDALNSFQKAVYQIGGASLQVARQFSKTPIFATIVIKGKLFVYTRQDEKLKPIKHLLYTTVQTVPETSERPEYSIPLVMIDIVHDTYFSDYLELLEKDLKVLEDIQKILKERSKGDG